MVESRLRRHFDYYLGKTEVVIYPILAVLLAFTALLTIATASKILWIGLNHWTVAAQTLGVLNELLIVLMLVEILHTVRISIRSHVLVTEPFLVIGLIAGRGSLMRPTRQRISKLGRYPATRCRSSDLRIIIAPMWGRILWRQQTLRFALV